ncbi:SDR family oxidoreductase [Nocardioides daejeonensis]|uniref:SDR family oxidoreductase n=1 Tax=Nocardioides daejeonensis TaxID=1046556 RepID=UPI000D74FD3B|nr:SDR family NAD(P)-dependent oxidoreductase [Nocardioides daejeonensis]
MEEKKVLIVIGAGPGSGLAVARRFASEGFRPALLGRSQESMDELCEALAGEGVEAYAAPIDLLDADDVRHSVAAVGERFGRIDVLHFNPSVWRDRGVLELTVPELLEDVTFGAGALLPAVQAAHPFLRRGSRILVTGSMAADAPAVAAPSLGIQKAAVRTLATALDKTLEPEGIRAVTMQVNGALAKEGPFAPVAVADALWAASDRPDEEWSSYVPLNG